LIGDSLTQTLEVQERSCSKARVFIEAQRLSHNGQFWLEVSTANHLVEESFRIFQYDGERRNNRGTYLQRFHPEDAPSRNRPSSARRQDGKNSDLKNHRLRDAGLRSVKYVHVVAHALNDVSAGVEFVGAVMDVTAAKQAKKRCGAEVILAEAQRLSIRGVGLGG